LIDVSERVFDLASVFKRAQRRSDSYFPLAIDFYAWRTVGGSFRKKTQTMRLVAAPPADCLSHVNPSKSLTDKLRDDAQHH